MGRHARPKDDDHDPKLDKGLERKSNRGLVWLFFSLGFIIVLLSSVAILFPGLIISIVDVNLFGEPFEIGTLGIPFIIVNVIVFTLISLHLKQRLPKIFTNISEKIFSFDLSKRNSFVILSIILTIYIATSANELSIN